jgi:hypothetical protein
MDICLLCLYVVLSCVGIGLCDGLITRPEESYRVYVCVWSRNNEKGGQRSGLDSKRLWMNELYQFLLNTFYNKKIYVDCLRTQMIQTKPKWVLLYKIWLRYISVRCQVLTVAFMKMTAFCDIAPCSLVEIDRRFRSVYCLHDAESVCTSETPFFFNETTQRFIQEACHVWRLPYWLDRN